MDLTKPLTGAQGGKLLKNLEMCQTAKDKIGNMRAVANKRKAAGNTDSIPTLKELLRMKETAVNPLNYNCDFSRLTQLFQRPLQIKYYAKKQADDVKKQR